MKPKPTPLRYFIWFGLAGLVIDPIVAVLLGWVWMEHYTRTTGFDAGNAPPFFFAVGLLFGPVVFGFLGWLIHRISSAKSV